MLPSTGSTISAPRALRRVDSVASLSGQESVEAAPAGVQRSTLSATPGLPPATSSWRRLRAH